MSIDFYVRDFDKCILISGDGDFGCIVEFLSNKSTISCIIVPDKRKCSILLKNKNVEIIFLNDHYYKFSDLINKKAPDTDASV